MPYVLRFVAQKSEDDVENVFLQRGGTLGAAAARELTDIALSHSDRATHLLLTDKTVEVDVPLSDKLIETSRQEFLAETGKTGIAAPDGREVLLLSERTQLLFTSSRKTASINGTTCTSLSGQACTPLSTLFSTVTASELTSEHPARPTVTATPFRSIDLTYSNWPAATARVTCASPRVVRVDAETGAEESVSIAFFVPAEKTKRIASSEPILKKVYDTAWASTEQIVGKIPNLTKSVLSAPYGINGSGFALAAAANDAPASAPPEVFEAVMARAIRVDDANGVAEKMIAALAEPSYAASIKFGERLTTALSAAVTFAMPYRVDEGVRVSPTGLECSQSESWKFEADRCFGTTADDCEGSARLMQGILRTAAELDERGVDMQAYPTLRALANFQKHYLPGLTVLAANAGHADAANQESATLAGHCILSCVSKYEFARARAASLGASAGTGEKTVPAFEPAHAKRVRDATFSALYPPELLEQLNEKERPHFESYDTAHALHGEMTKSNADPVFLLEGTAFASSRAYTHTFEERATRSQFANEAKRLSSKFEPNIARGNKTLDCGAGNKHAFYDSIVEFGVSTRSPLFTDAALRSLNAACTNFRFAQLPENGVLKAAGASPKELASREYALSPMFSLGTHDAATLTEATEEALANAMPMRGVPMRLSDEQADNVSIGLESLRELHKHLNSTKDTPDVPRLATTYILSWASIVENPASIESLCASLMEDVQLTGDVCGIDDPVKGLAVDETGDEMGRLVHLELSIPC